MLLSLAMSNKEEMNYELRIKSGEPEVSRVENREMK